MKVLYVDDEPNILSGLRRMLRKLEGQWSMQFVQGGQEALSTLANEHFDVIVSDVRMPGMDGVELLTRVQEEYPEIIRIILSGHAAEGTMLRAVGPAHQCLSKPCDSEQLQLTVSRAVRLREAMHSEQLQKVVARLTRLPSVPALYEKIMQELRCEDPAIANIAQVVGQDMAMSAKILQLTNSSFFGLSTTMTDSKRAVIYLGINTIRALALQSGIFGQLMDNRFTGLVQRLSDHGRRTALAARAIAEVEEAGKEAVEVAFQVGLLHDIGWLVLATNLPDQCAELLGRDGLEGDPSLVQEIETFGVTHSQIGGYLLGIWGEAVMFHHEVALVPSVGFDVVLALQFADTADQIWQQTGSMPDAQVMQQRLPHMQKVSGRFEEWVDACRRAMVEEE
jgi:HD-like signal output (HDOD) protein